jgi:hypothetical protein
MLRLIRTVLVAVAAFGVPAAVAAGCADDEVASADANATEGIKFEELDVRASSPQAGLKIFKSKSAYKKFFGEEPPAGVDFKKHWVVHVSMGMANTGGYSVDIGKIERTGGSKKTLVVHATYNIPGPDCIVTQAITNPQMTVRINKQPSTPKQKLFTHSNVYPCSGGACADLGGLCLSSPIDVTFGANCEEDYGFATDTSGECAAINQSCCVPKQCGGFAGLPCDAGEVCVDYPGDGCDPNNGGADCGGLCVKEMPCGGFTPNPQKCPKGFTCVVEGSLTGGIPADLPGQCVPDFKKECAPVVCTLFCENGFEKDANGCEICSCKERTPASGWCVKNSGDKCESDADCTNGGCGGELCYNPAMGGGISTCECTKPAYACGCVNGKCAWYE